MCLCLPMRRRRRTCSPTNPRECRNRNRNRNLKSSNRNRKRFQFLIKTLRRKQSLRPAPPNESLNRSRWKKQTTSFRLARVARSAGHTAHSAWAAPREDSALPVAAETLGTRVSENWLKYEIDPRISAANRVYVTFDVARDGSPRNVQVEQSSGVPSLDQSAVRALQRIDTFGPLPSDYSGNKVSVEFWFDYNRK
ncbi:MAG: hypothetical protein DMG90_07875 [Acidobacteria bacterium]|nr:MAG: hypothetical protein DMG90_07875 [Acidobacteriota bacterium]